MPTIVETAITAGSFTTLVAAVKAAGLVDALSGPGPFTVFAPTDEAFAKLPPELLQTLLTPEGKTQLTEILTYHVVSGHLTSAEVVGITSATTLQGQTLRFDASDGVNVNESKVVAADIEADNGIIHVIDAVLVPA